MRVLLPIDGSDCSKKTMHWVTGFFDPKNTQFDLFYVWRSIPDVMLNVVEFNIDEFLAAQKKSLEEKGFQVVRTQWEMGDPAREICRYADTNPVDLVVLGSHGNTGLARFLLGSVSIAVLEHCKKPVLIHRNVIPEPTSKKKARQVTRHEKETLKEISR